MKRDLSIEGCLFRPSSIAVVGASAEVNKHSGLIQHYLRRHGYAGAIYPVNPRHREVQGEPAFPTVLDIGRHIDHAFITLPTSAVLEAVIQCGEAGIPCATILASGYAESGADGRVKQRQLIETARSYGTRLLGPNSLGLINLTDRVALSVSEVLSLPSLRSGRYSVISQSGGMMGALLSHGDARGIGFSKLVSTGNEADIGVGEIGEFLVDDPHTDVILLFLETIRNPDRMEAMVRRAHRAGKPVVAFSTARSRLGEELAVAHTGALAGGGAVMTAFLRDIGVVRVNVLEALLDIAPLLQGRRPPPAGGVSVVTTTGGGGALVVDCLSGLGVDVLAPSEKSRSQLKVRGIEVGESALVDVTLAGTNAETYGAVLQELLSASHTQAVVAVVGASSQFRPDRAVEPILAAKQASTAQALAVFLTPAADQSMELLRRHGIAVFRSPEACADAIKAYLEWQTPRSPAPPSVDLHATQALLQKIADDQLSSEDANGLLDTLGIPRAPTVLLPPSLDAWTDEQLDALRYPVVAKISAPNLVHKTELGAVALGIQTVEQLRSASRDILQRLARVRPDILVKGIEVQPMEQGLIEILIGYRDDPQVGPIIAVGLGGVLAELHRDVAISLAPVDQRTARAMLRRVRGMATILGFRNLPRGDVEALISAICKLSSLAVLRDRPILEAEINPFIVRAEGQGAIAVDILARRS
jgi:acyl-CoA synthetase (NDP forming)